MDRLAIISTLIGAGAAITSIGTFLIKFLLSYVEKHMKTGTKAHKFISSLFEIEKPDDLQNKIKKATNNLQNISAQINEIQSELEQKIQFVNDLQTKAEDAENLAKLNEEQAKLINKMINKSSNKGIVATIIFGFIFFILGAVVSYFLTK